MIKKEIAICDCCKDTIAEKKKGIYTQCELCGNHVCSNCQETNDVEFYELSLNRILLCSSCIDKFEDNDKAVELIKISKSGEAIEIKKFIIGYLKKVMLLSDLKGDK